MQNILIIMFFYIYMYMYILYESMYVKMKILYLIYFLPRNIFRQEIYFEYLIYFIISLNKDI